jgi:hypothetical protein
LTGAVTRENSATSSGGEGELVQRSRLRFSHAVVAGAALALALAACDDEDDAAKKRDRTKPEPDAATAEVALRRDAGEPKSPPKPKGPPKKLFAKRFVAKIRVAPHKEAFRIGYLRGGAILQAKTAEPVGYDKCRKGWFELQTGGFICSTLDVIPFLGRRPPERRALQPDLEAPLPYPYGYSRRANTPVFRRLPTDEEAARFQGYRIPGHPPPDAGAVEAADAGTAGTADGAGAAGDIEDPDAGVPTLDSLMGEDDSVLLRRMERGFYVSLDREMRKGRRRYWRTQANGFIPYRRLFMVRGSKFEGTHLDQPEPGAGSEAEAEAGSATGAGSETEPEAETASETDPKPEADVPLTLPIGYVMSSKHRAYRVNERGRLRRAGKPGYHHRFKIIGEAEIRGTEYWVGADGLHYRKRDTTRIDAREPPDEVGPEEKWLDIDLATQSLVAYEGSQPVFATLVSTGRVKDPDDPLRNHTTPTGSFRITSKHLTATMDGDHAIDGPYSIEDVPYVMYFQLAYALHSAFWHNTFGRPRSHGCINLAPKDARFIFNWTTPKLPYLWHGVYPTEDAPGTRLFIRGETPEG